jgi:uncharacterized protein
MPSDAFGLTSSTLAAIQQTLALFPEIEQVIVYGSRAMGRERPGSDIDLMIQGADFTHQQLLSLLTQLDDLMLPYSFDLCRQQDIANPDLLEHIRRVGKVFYPANR